MPFLLASLLLLAASSAFADGIAVEDRPLQPPAAPENPGGPRPILRDCEVTTARTKDASGAEVETTHRVCRWAVPPA